MGTSMRNLKSIIIRFEYKVLLPSALLAIAGVFLFNGWYQAPHESRCQYRCLRPRAARDRWDPARQAMARAERNNGAPRAFLQSGDIVVIKSTNSIFRITQVDVNANSVQCDYIETGGALHPGKPIPVGRIWQLYREKSAYILRKGIIGGVIFDVGHAGVKKTFIVNSEIVRQCAETGINVTTAILNAMKALEMGEGVEYLERLPSPFTINPKISDFEKQLAIHTKEQDMTEYLSFYILQRLASSVNHKPADVVAAAPQATTSHAADKALHGSVLRPVAMDERISPRHPGQVSLLIDYLAQFQGNDRVDISRFIGILSRPGAKLLEIGCGSGDAARFIAGHHEDIGVMATDISYDKDGMLAEEERLGAQGTALPNLAFAQSLQDIVEYLPDASIDYILLVSPEDTVIGELFEMIGPLKIKLKAGGQIIIKAYYDFAEAWADQFAEAGMRFERYPPDYRFLGDVDLSAHTRASKSDKGVFIWTNSLSSQQKVSGAFTKGTHYRAVTGCI